MSTTAAPPTLTPAAPPRPPILLTLGRVLLAVFCVWLVGWSFVGLHFDFSHFGTGVSRGAEYFSSLFPHTGADWWYILGRTPPAPGGVTLPQRLAEPLAETIQMAVVGTTLGALLAFPVSFLAARTGALPGVVPLVVKTFLNIARAIPTIIYALIVVSAIGLGPSAGAIAIAFVTFISLSKLYAEALESVAVGPIEAVRASGGNAAQVFVYGMLPQVFPSYLSTMLYSLEYNIKDSFVVGIVGAGGLGFELLNAIRLFHLQDAGAIIILLIVLINLIDTLSLRVRRVFS